jgi:hypothetical protein
VIEQPTPAIPTFVDGLITHQTDLNSLVANINNLYLTDLGAFRTTNPCCAVRVTGTHSVPNSTEVQIPWDVADINNDAMWSASSPTILTINTAGVYLVQVTLGVVTGSAQQIAARILVNGTFPPTDAQVTSSMLGFKNIASSMVPLEAGSVINATIFHTVGSTVNLDTTKGSCRMSAHRISL